MAAWGMGNGISWSSAIQNVWQNCCILLVLYVHVPTTYPAHVHTNIHTYIAVPMHTIQRPQVVKLIECGGLATVVV